MIDDYVTKGEQVIVNEATLREVSHVTFPAFGEYAQITEVAASADTSQPTESEETIVSNEVTPEVVEEVATEVVATPAVEAQERNARPAIFTAPRSPIVSKGSYLEHSLRAALGNDESRQYVMAADTTGNNAGFIPTPQSTEVINGIANADRGFENEMYKPQGRFPANILVSDDMLNDGVITKSLGGNSTNIGGFVTTYSDETKRGMKSGFGDKGTNSRYYDIDKWFNNLLE